MSDFKKGDRVEFRGVVTGELITGTVHRHEGTFVEGETDAGYGFSMLPISITKITPAAPRFEDVKTGDRVTLEGADYSITGTVRQAGLSFVFVGGSTFYYIGNEAKRNGTGPSVTLTAHEPAEPEWHQAKVIKADSQGWTGELLLRTGDGKFMAVDQVRYSPHLLTNVVIIVDADGNVVAS